MAKPTEGPSEQPGVGAPGFPGVASGAFGLAGYPGEFLGLALTAAAAVGIPNSSIARDYWLTSCLYGLAEASGPEGFIYQGQGKRRVPLAKCVFAGGTSLVSAWGITERYSEDLDVLALIVKKDATTSARKRPLSVITNWAAKAIEVGDVDVSSEEMSNVGFRRAHLNVGDYPRFLKIETTVEDFADGICETHSVMSLMGRFATPEQMDKHPELGGFEMLCVTPSYTAANKLDALHRRASTQDFAGLVARGRDLYDLAAIAASEHAAAARRAIPDFAERAARSQGNREPVPRPINGYANSILFRSGSQAQQALKAGFEETAPLVWGHMFTFEEALEMAASLDSP